MLLKSIIYLHLCVTYIIVIFVPFLLVSLFFVVFFGHLAFSVLFVVFFLCLFLILLVEGSPLFWGVIDLFWLASRNCLNWCEIRVFFCQKWFFYRSCRVQSTLVFTNSREAEREVVVSFLRGLASSETQSLTGPNECAGYDTKPSILRLSI